MKFRNIIIIIFNVFTLIAMAQNDYQGCYEDNIAFQSGESIQYEGAYNFGFLWLTAGGASFSVRDTTINETEAFHIIGKGSTYPNYDKFFKVRDQYESFLDKENHLPMKFIRKVEEGNFTLHNQYTFYPDSNYFNADFIKRQGKLKRKNIQFYLPDCSHDVLSAVYFVRNIDFKSLQKGDRVAFKIMIDRSIYDVDIEYNGQEVKKVRKGKKYLCNKITFKLIAGTIFDDGQNMQIWSTADDNNLPVAIESPLVVGKAKFYTLSISKI